MALAVSLQDVLLRRLGAQPTNVAHDGAPCAAPQAQAATPQELRGCRSPEHTPRSRGLHGRDGVSSLLTAESLGKFSQFLKGLKPEGPLWGR